MSLLKYAAAAAIGYFAGQPAGRRQLARLRANVTKMLRSPQASAALDRVRRKNTEQQAAGDADRASVGPETELSGRAVAEERRADVTPPTV